MSVTYKNGARLLEVGVKKYEGLVTSSKRKVVQETEPAAYKRRKDFNDNFNCNVYSNNVYSKTLSVYLS